MLGIKVFNHKEFGDIRTIEDNGELWFIGFDVAEALHYKNQSDAVINHVDLEDRRVILKSQITTLENVPNRGLICINESGLYSLILGSQLESAKQFKRWVTSDVLPQIRTTGGYQKHLSHEEMMRIQLGMYDGHEERLTHLENTMTIDYGQQQELKKAVNKKVIQLLGGKSSPAYKNMSKRLFSECNHDIQDYFSVNSRNNIPTVMFSEALQYVDGWNPSTNTVLEVRRSNAGVQDEAYAV